MKPVLLDTGCIVALLDRSEKYHHRCVQVISKINAPFITCEAVIAESCYLLRSLPGAIEAILANVEKQRFHITLQLSLHVPRIQQIIKRFQKPPMDLADACLVYLAEEYETPKILTLDSDFSYYRWKKNNSFENLIFENFSN